MLIVSCRKDFRDDYECGDNQVADVDLTAPADEICPIDISSLEDCLPSSGRETLKILLLIHGYNNTFGDVKDAYKIIQDNQRKWIRFHDIVIGFTWPGGNEFLAYENARNSLIDENSCVVDKFTDLLIKLDDFCAVKSVDTLSHSLGCRISLAAYTRLSKNNNGKKLRKLHRQFLTGADVNIKSIVRGGHYFDGSNITESCHVFYSKKDEVLNPFVRGFVGGGIALGSRGPKGVENISLKIYGVNCSNVLPHKPDSREIHSRYKCTKEVYKHMKRAVNGKNVERWTHFQQTKFNDRG